MKSFTRNLFLATSTVFVSSLSHFAQSEALIQDINGAQPIAEGKVWLSHEHTLVDFIGADKIDSDKWDHDEVLKAMLPYFAQLKAHKVEYFVDATPMYIGRDVRLLKKISDKTGLKVITNTGLYGAREKIFIPSSANKKTAEALASEWISEFKNGIDGTDIKPGFIKIGVDVADPLEEIDQRLIKAAALTHLETGLTIASHTGSAVGVWPQIKTLLEMGVSPQAFIWVHAQFEPDNALYLEAAKLGAWISLDGLAWDIDDHVKKLVFAKENNILDQVLISHDAGWFDPQKETQAIKPYTDLFTKLFPRLKEKGFTDEELHRLISVNPAKAFSIKIRKN